MMKKTATKIGIPAILVLSAALPGAVLAQEGDKAMSDETMMAAVSCQQDYTVQADDWLSKIAEKFYGDVLTFPAIAQATNAHYDAAMMAEGDTIMADKEAMADKEMMAEEKLMVAGMDGAMMDVMMAGGKMMVKSADGQMMEVMLDADSKLLAADGSMVDGKLVLAGADGQMMDVMMAEGKLMTKGVDGAMMEVAMMDGEMMADDKTMADTAMADKAMAGDEAMMMAGGYAFVENPDVIEPGWVLCIPSLEDVQGMMAAK